MEEKIEKTIRKDGCSEEEKISTIKHWYKEIGSERNAFLGYIQMKMNMSNIVFFNKLGGATKFSPVEVEYLMKVMEDRPWRQML